VLERRGESARKKAGKRMVEYWFVMVVVWKAEQLLEAAAQPAPDEHKRGGTKAGYGRHRVHLHTIQKY
jgi:hypothetical protein